jgi:hypothetical protein
VSKRTNVLSKDVGDSSLVAVRKLEQLKKAVDDSSIKAQVRERVVRVSLQLFDSACHATEKSDAIACAMEMPVIPVNRVVDPKGIIGKNRVLRRRKGTRGR